MAFIPKGKLGKLRIILGFVVISFVSDLACWIIILTKSGSTYWIINIYQYSEVILVYIFLYLALNRKVHTLTIMGLMIFLTIWNHISSGNMSLVAESASINSVFVLFLCLLFLVGVFKKEEGIFIENDPVFWMVVGLLAYFSGGLFSWLLKSYGSLELNGNWAFHNLANTLKNLLFAVGFWKARQMQALNPNKG